MRKLLLLALVCMSLGASGADKIIPLNDFGQENLKKWFVRQGMKVESVNVWPDGIPGYHGKLTYQKYVPGKEAWPAVLLLGNKIPYRDWRRAAWLEFDCFAQEAGTLSVQVRSPHWYTMVASIKPGRNLLRLPVEVRTLDNVSQIHLYCHKPVKDWTIHLGNLRLVEPDMEEDLRGFRQELQGFKPGSFAHLPMEEQEELTGLQGKCASRLGQSELRNDDYAYLKDALNRLRQKCQESKIMGRWAHEGMVAFWCSSEEKIRRQAHEFVDYPVEQLDLSVAQGECEGGQVVFRSARAMESVHVRVSSWPCLGDGRPFATDCITITPVGYVNCTYEAPEAAWWPDPLLTYAANLRLEADCWQPWYMEVKTPASQHPGVYRGRIEILSGARVLCSLPFSIRVWNFVLPAGVPYFMATSTGNDQMISRMLGAKEAEAWRKAATDMFLEHRINPDAIYGNPQPVAQIKYKLARGANAFCIHHLDEYDKKRVPGRIKGMKALMEHYRKQGIDVSKIYCYGWDERGPELFQAINDVARGIKSGIPDLMFVTTSSDETFGLGSPLRDVDMFVPGIQVYERNLARIAASRAKGHKVGWYICVGPQPPYPNVFVECPLLDARLLMGAMYWKYQPDGFLYWSLARFVQPVRDKGKRVWKVAEKWMSGAPLTDWNPCSFGKTNGDGALIYPCRQGPVPTLRLKAIRDGLEDYLYFRLLADALNMAETGKAPMDDLWLGAARKALRIEPELVASLREHCRKSSEWQHRRIGLATLLETYHTKTMKEMR